MYGADCVAVEEADGVGVWVDEVDREAIGDMMVFARGFAITVADAVVDDGTDVLLESTIEAVADAVNEEPVVAMLVRLSSDVDMLVLRLSVLFDAESICDDCCDVCCRLGDADRIDPEAPVVD